VGSEAPGPMESFETWFLRRVTQAVEAGDVAADLLMELQREIKAAKSASQEEGHARAVRDVAERLGIPVEQVEEALDALEAQPSVTRELFMRRTAEGWLEGQREAYRTEQEKKKQRI